MRYDKDKAYRDVHETAYFGINVRAFTCAGSLQHHKPFPWRFEIEFEGKLYKYHGMPNYVETKKKALKRAWYRAKWLSEGTYNTRYK